MGGLWGRMGRLTGAISGDRDGFASAQMLRGGKIEMLRVE